MKLINFKNRQRQQGIATVETVIATPVVLFLLIAVAEFGYAILQYNTLTQAVRDGARYIAEEAGAGTGVIQLTGEKIDRTRNLVAYGSIVGSTPVLPGLAPGSVTIAAAGAGNVSVTATYDYQPIFTPNLPELVGATDAGGAFTMNAQVVMRVL